MALTNPLYNALPKLSNIQGFWRFEDNFNDTSANANNLTETSGTIPFVTGKIDKAGDFEANETEYLAIAHASQTGLSISGDITVCCWVKMEQVTDGVYRIVSKYDRASVGSYGYSLWFYGNGDTVRFSAERATTRDLKEAISTDTLSAATWYHLAGTLNQATDELQVYINGSANGAAVAMNENISTNTVPFAIGASFNGATPESYMDGLIDEVIVWNTCLTASEIAKVASITSSSKYKKTAAGGFSGFSPYIF